jgi:hypothetical protein
MSNLQDDAPMSLETLASSSSATGNSAAWRGTPMPDELRQRYGGPLEVPQRADRPTILVNFVSTIDGVVALGPGEERGGGVISGSFEPDRFVMALLRAVADVVLMGAARSRDRAAATGRPSTSSRSSPGHSRRGGAISASLRIRPRSS